MTACLAGGISLLSFFGLTFGVSEPASALACPSSSNGETVLTVGADCVLHLGNDALSLTPISVSNSSTATGELDRLEIF